VHYEGPFSIDDRVSLFNAIGSGALAHLECLSLIVEFPKQPPQHDFNVPANCLPRLRALRLEAPHMPEPLVAALMAAAGPTLSVLTTRGHEDVADRVLRLLASQDFPWLSGLKTLSLDWFTLSRWGDATLPRLTAVLTRLPALKHLKLRGPTYDDVAVHLMTLVETGRLTNLATLKLSLPGSNAGRFTGGISDEIRLLLALWLKRQARGGRLIKCDMKELHLSAGGFRTWVGTKTDECIAQIEKARAQM
jgi:hypothetical protein